MNKHHKAESRRVKALLQLANAGGCQYTYRQVRRQVRQWDRDIKAIPTVAFRGISKGFKRLNYEVVNAARSLAGSLNGLNASFIVIDESGPIDETPFEKRYLGKWNLPKEETE